PPSRGEGESVEIFTMTWVNRYAPAPVLQRFFQILDDARAVFGVQLHTVLNDFERRAVALVDARITLLRKKTFDFGFGEIRGHRDGEGNEARHSRARARQHVFDDRLRRVAPHFGAAAAAIEPCGARIQELQVIVDLRHGADGGTRRAHRIGLIDRDGGRDPVDALRGGLVHALQKLPRVGREGFDIAPLPLGVDGVEGERGLTRARNAGNDDELVQGQLEVEALQIVLTGAFNDDAVV